MWCDAWALWNEFMINRGYEIWAWICIMWCVLWVICHAIYGMLTEFSDILTKRWEVRWTSVCDMWYELTVTHHFWCVVWTLWRIVAYALEYMTCDVLYELSDSYLNLYVGWVSDILWIDRWDVRWAGTLICDMNSPIHNVIYMWHVSSDSWMLYNICYVTWVLRLVSQVIWITDVSAIWTVNVM